MTDLAERVPSDSSATPRGERMVALADSSVEPFDYLLYRVDADPRTRSAALDIEILERAPDWHEVLKRFDRASRLLPRLRQRVSEPTLPGAAARWTTDLDFDLAYHVRRCALPAPGSLRQLLDFAVVEAESPLDPARPLWEATLVEGLPGGRAALLLKISHALADGSALLQMQDALFDSEPDAPTPRFLPLPPSSRPTPLEAVAREMRDVSGGAGRVVLQALTGCGDLVREWLRAPIECTIGWTRVVRSAGRLISTPTAPSPLLRRRGLRSRVETAEVPLESLRAAADRAGGTINDALLAAVCAGLGRYHECLGLPVEGVPIAIPVSVRRPEDPPGGNRWSAARFRGATGPKDPVARIRELHEEALAARTHLPSAGLTLAARIAGRLPGALLTGVAAPILSSTDVQVSNVRGPCVPRYLAGARVERMCPVGPLPGVAVMVVLVSYLGTGYLGVRYDLDAITHPELFEWCLHAGLAEVVALGLASG